MTRLALALLGPFQATLDRQLISGFASNRVRALLAYLAVESGQAHARETLAGLLWPGYADTSALTNLRQALANLRQALDDQHADPPFLLITRETIQLNPACDCSVDVARLHAAARARPTEAGAVERWQEAAALYRGPFLQGFSLSDSPAFDEWLTLQREQSAREMLQVLQRLAADHELRGDDDAFQECAQRQVDLDPTQEEGQRQLMRALALSGQRSAALAQYQSCRRVLAEQVGVEPAAETTALYERIRAGELARSPTPSSAAAPPEPVAALPVSESAPLPDEDLEPDAPPPLFVAREEELAQLDRWLGEALAGRGRVGFVLGEPGSGKTALAREFARRAMEQHPDLIVAWGNGNAYSGLGDPYLPFMEVLAMLTADIEGQRAAGSMSREHAHRLRALLPTTIGALLEGSLGLIDLFVPGPALLARTQSLAARRPDGRGTNEAARRPDGRTTNEAAVEPVRSSPVRGVEPARRPDGHTTNEAAVEPVRGGSVRGTSDGTAAATAACARLQEALQRRAALAAAAPVSQTDLFQQVTRFLQALARQQPLVLVLDDLQWADTSSIALLFHLARHLAGRRILVIGQYRPEEVAAGRDGQPHPLAAVVAECRRLGGHVGLDLAQAEGRRLVDALVDSEPNHLGAAFRDALYARTGGHALFTVELWRGLRERGDLQRDGEGYWVQGPELDWARLPARLEAAVAATVDRLPEAWRELLTVASVEGEEFTGEVVARVLGLEEREVLRTLSGPLTTEHRLTRPISLQRRGDQRLSRYRFRHFLFQDYLYRHLDDVERTRTHEEVGLALEALYCPRLHPMASPSFSVVDVLTWSFEDPTPIGVVMGDVSTFDARVSTQLARHFELAGMPGRAITYYTDAAWQADARGAVEQCLAHELKALSLVPGLPPGPQRFRAEFWLQTYAADDASKLRSHLLPDIGARCHRIYELSLHLGEEEQCTALNKLINHGVVWGGVRQACEWGERSTALAQSLHPTLLLATRGAWAFAQLHSGAYAAACGNLDALIRPCLTSDPPSLASRYIFHVHHLAHGGWALWCLGYPDRALRVAEVVLQMGYVTESLSLIVQALCDATPFVHQLRREALGVQKPADEFYALIAEGRDPPVMRPFAPLYRGWVQVHTGALEEGIATLRQGLAAWDARFGVLRAHWRGYLAEALGMAGRPAEGLALLEEALAEVERTGDRFSVAETWRLKGELVLQCETTSPPAPLRAGEGSKMGAEECFLKAIEIAREQEARSWELRATASLARLWQAQGKVAAAREALAAIYGWFTEGFDTPDLVEARALLDELGAATG